MSLLTRFAQRINIDVDDASTAVVRSLPFTPYNQTSNQGIVTAELLKPENAGLLKDLVAKFGADGWEKVYEEGAVAVTARNVPYLSGRVLIQVSLRHLNDVDAILAQCRRYAASYAAAGISTDRYAIKLPFSGAAAAAARILKAEGIPTLATSVFCVEQAVAASQAGCVMISPYYNEIKAHLDPAYRIKVDDVALQHPMSPRILQIQQFFASQYAATGTPQPIMVIASHLSAKEVYAMADLGCSHITVSAPNLVALAETVADLPPETTEPKPAPSYEGWTVPERLKGIVDTDPLAPAGWKGVTASNDTDYVADGGKKLDEYICSDELVSKRIEDARQFFLDAENTAKAAIEALIAAN